MKASAIAVWHLCAQSMSSGNFDKIPAKIRAYGHKGKQSYAGLFAVAQIITPAGGGGPAGVIKMTGNWEEECCQSHRRSAGRRSAPLRIPFDAVSGLGSVGIMPGVRPVRLPSACRLTLRGALVSGPDHFRSDACNIGRPIDFVQCNIRMDDMHPLHARIRQPISYPCRQICHGFLYFALILPRIRRV